MIVTDKFVFVHLHKSGGTFVTKVIEHLFPESQKIGYHYPMSMIPTQYSHLPVLGVVRNPWMYYVSYYCFQKSLVTKFETEYGSLSDTAYSKLIECGIDPRNGIDIIFDILSKEGQCDFSEITNSLLNLCMPGGKLDEVLDMMPTQLNKRSKNSPIQKEKFRGKNITRSHLEKMRNTGEGMYTFLFKHLYSDYETVHFLRTDNLREDLIAFLSQLYSKIDKDYILHASPENVSSHSPYYEYYDSQLKNLVQKRDAFIIDKFNFAFGD